VLNLILVVKALLSYPLPFYAAVELLQEQFFSGKSKNKVNIYPDLRMTKRKFLDFTATDMFLAGRQSPRMGLRPKALSRTFHAIRRSFSSTLCSTDGSGKLVEPQFSHETTELIVEGRQHHRHDVEFRLADTVSSVDQRSHPDQSATSVGMVHCRYGSGVWCCWSLLLQCTVVQRCECSWWIWLIHVDV